MNANASPLPAGVARPGLLPGALAIIAFGLTLPLTRLGVLASSALDVMLVRLLLASVGAVLWLLVLHRPLPPRRNWPGFVWVIFGVVLGFPGFMALSMTSAGSAHGGVILGVLPLATAVVGCWVSHERPSVWFWVSAVVGCALVMLFAMLSSGSSAWQADVWLLLAVVSAAFGYAFGARLSTGMPAADVIAWALAVMLPVALLGAVFVDWSGLSADALGPALWPVWGSLLYLGLISQFGGFLLWYRSLALDGVARASQLQLLQPFVTLVAAALFLHERIDLLTIGFAVLILASVALSRRARVMSTSAGDARR